MKMKQEVVALLDRTTPDTYFSALGWSCITHLCEEFDKTLSEQEPEQKLKRVVVFIFPTAGEFLKRCRFLAAASGQIIE